MSARDDFWESGLPFISDRADRRVDWTDVGLLGLGTVLTSVFSSIADLVATLWDVIVIQRANDVANAYSGFVQGTFVQAVFSLDFSSATQLAAETGLLGSIVLIAAGTFLIAWVIGVIRE